MAVNGGKGKRGNGRGVRKPLPLKPRRPEPRGSQGKAAKAPGGAEGVSWEWLVDPRVRFGGRQEAAFAEDGYVVFPRLLSDRGLEYLRGRVDAIHAARHPSVDEEWILDLHQVLPEEENWMWGLATHPTILAMVESGLGEKPKLYASQLHRKRPGGGGHVVPFHQDGNERGRTLWVCLDPVDAASGGLRMLAGWHRKGRMPLARVETEAALEDAEYFARHNVFGVDTAAAERMPPTEGVARLDRPTCYEMPAGGAGMHHPLAPHASGRNACEGRDRRVIILRYMAAGEPSQRASVRHWRTGESFDKACFTAERGAPPPPCVGR